MPKILFAYNSKNVSIKIEAYICGQVLGKNRDDFRLPKNNKKNKIIEKIRKISYLETLDNSNLQIYDIQNKVLKYLDVVHMIVVKLK